MKWRQNGLCPICLLLACIGSVQAQEEAPVSQLSPPPVTTTFNGDLSNTLEKWRKVAEIFFPPALKPEETAISGGQVELRVSDAQAMLFFRYGF